MESAAPYEYIIVVSHEALQWYRIAQQGIAATVNSGDSNYRTSDRNFSSDAVLLRIKENEKLESGVSWSPERTYAAQQKIVVS
jgi:hypothetical protein